MGGVLECMGGLMGGRGRAGTWTSTRPGATRSPAGRSRYMKVTRVKVLKLGYCEILPFWQKATRRQAKQCRRTCCPAGDKAHPGDLHDSLVITRTGQAAQVGVYLKGFWGRAGDAPPGGRGGLQGSASLACGPDSSLSVLPPASDEHCWHQYRWKHRQTLVRFLQSAPSSGNYSSSRIGYGCCGWERMQTLLQPRTLGARLAVWRCHQPVGILGHV